MTKRRRPGADSLDPGPDISRRTAATAVASAFGLLTLPGCGASATPNAYGSRPHLKQPGSAGFQLHGPSATDGVQLAPPAPTTIAQYPRSAPPDYDVWALGSSSTIDFVIDCGADPTGATDVAPAFDRAYELLSALASTGVAANPLRLFVPQGVYLLASAPTTPRWEFVYKTTAVEIVGAGIDATIFQLAGYDPPYLANLQYARLADFTTQGTLLGQGFDCAVGWAIRSAEHVAVVERIKLFNVNGQSSSCLITTAGLAHVRDSLVACCGAKTDGSGVITVIGCEQTLIEACTCLDVGAVNGVWQDGNILYQNRTWLAVVGDATVAGAQVHIASCFLDENVQSNAIISGSPAAPFGCVRVTNCLCNPPIQGPTPLACLDVSNVAVLEVDGLCNSGFNQTTAAATVALHAVTTAYLRAVATATGTSSGYVSADTTTAKVVARDSANIDWSQINYPTVLDIDDPRATTAQLTDAQLVVIGGHQIVAGTTSGSASVTVRTFYQPPNNHAALADIVWSAGDVGNGVAYAGRVAATVRNMNGPAIAGTPVFGDESGDLTLTGAKLVLGIDQTGLTVTFVPPANYSGDISWTVGIIKIETPAYA